MAKAALTAVVCDDEPAKRRAVAERLVEYGCSQVTQTSSLTELRVIVAATAPTIIVLDLALAGMGGLEIVRDLHALCHVCAIIVMTPFTILREDAIAAGARGLVDLRDLRELDRLLATLTKPPAVVQLDPKTISLDAPATPAERPGT